MKTLVLASASPRRKEILENTGLRFKVDVGAYQEEMRPGMSPRSLARFLSAQKARAVAARYRKAIIISADTFIVFRKRMLGKPKSRAEAKKMLRDLSGREHLVITGFTIFDTATKRQVSRSVESKVFFRRLTRREIDAYVDSGEPLDKAGAYAVQGLGATIVRRIEGDYFNVVGLPVCSLAEELKKFGVHVLKPGRRLKRYPS